MVNLTDKISLFLLKVMYYYAKAFSMVHFSVKTVPNLQPSLVYSPHTKCFSIGCRLMCLIVYTAFLPGILVNEMQKTAKPKAFIDNYLLLILLVQFLTITVFTCTLITFHVVRHEKFVKVVNRAIDVFFRISKMANKEDIFTIDFCLMVLFRLAVTMYSTFMNVPEFYCAIVEGKYILVLEWFVEIYLWIGTLIVLDTCFVGYVAIGAMYKNIADYMIEFEERLEREDMQDMSKFCRKRMLRTNSEQLEECTLLYSEIFKIINDFHGLYQFNILFTFYMDFVSIIALAHYSFWSYIIMGKVLIHPLIMGSIRAIEVLLLVFAADTATRRSKTPKYLNWDSLCWNGDTRWDRAVDQFLNILRFQELKIDVYGLFQLNNELCLRVLSAIVAYLTILYQFGLLGYFHEGDYVFIQELN